MKRSLIFIVFLCCVLAPQLFRAKAVSGFVDHADVTWQTNGRRYHRHYTAPEKIQKLMYYLRALRPKGKADLDPEILAGTSCKIVLYYQNGYRQIYYLQADRYLSIDAHPWERVRPEQAEKLYPLLDEMPSDSLSAALTF